MNVSMWMIAQALKKYDCTVDIKEGSPCIRGVRFLAQQDFISPDMVYIGASNDFYGDRSTQGVFCCCRGDNLYITGEYQQDVFNDILSMLDRYSRWEFDSLACITSGQDLQALLDCSKNLPAMYLAVVERGGRVCSSCHTAGPEPAAFYDTGNGTYLCLDALEKIRIRASRKEAFYIPELSMYCRDLYDGPHRVGMLLLKSEEIMYPECMLQLASQISAQINRWISMHPDREELLLNANILQPLLIEQPEPACMEDFRCYLHQAGWKPFIRKILYLIQPGTDSSKKRAERRLREALPQAIVTDSVKGIVVLADLNLCPKQLLDRTLHEMQSYWNCRYGESYPFTRLDELYVCFRQAELALHSSCCENGTHTPELLEYFCELVRMRTTADLYHPALHILEEYDRFHHTNMLDTLEVYLITERNQKKTADLLYIHRNTLANRLERIRELCSISLDDTNTRLQLLFSFLLRSGGTLGEKYSEYVKGEVI